ncbi:CpsD/CapB family tyrosine-protein kinase [Flavimaricola marinus]|uniref:Tyrosine-protein kinase YwqD n=1 Tax=Flavimaricola marinus TaxID=1819565 RepID=A0A238LBD3_9RHOB|nr:CpsD/CapB family tyrosine-protein kinase [Flavimaricola marinus]SMY06882.1 Tyrosine-protein kinase YwqD [Flavimaricola marinus]
MNAKYSRRTGRPRLDASERARLLAEIAKLGAPATTELDAQSAALRAALSESVEPPADEPEAAQDAVTPTDREATAAAPIEQPKAPAEPAEPAAKPAAQPAPPQRAPSPKALNAEWAGLPMLDVSPALLERNLVITAKRTDPAHGAFDVLRTRLVQALAEKGWRRVAITSPTAGCGKSFTAINLAVTLSRYDQCRTILMDMDLRKPGLARYLGVRNAGSTGDYLRGLTDAPDYFTRLQGERLNIGTNLALGLNGQVEDFAAELFQQPSTGEVLAEMEDMFAPEVVLFDLPPALAQDDVIAFRPHFDCLLMVVGGGITTAEEVREAQRRIGEDKPLLGVVLNKAEVEGDYAY